MFSEIRSRRKGHKGKKRKHRSKQFKIATRPGGRWGKHLAKRRQAFLLPQFVGERSGRSWILITDSAFPLLQPHLHSYKEAFEEMQGTSPSSPPSSGGETSPPTPAFPVSPQTPYSNLRKFHGRGWERGHWWVAWAKPDLRGSRSNRSQLPNTHHHFNHPFTFSFLSVCQSWLLPPSPFISACCKFLTVSPISMHSSMIIIITTAKFCNSWGDRLWLEPLATSKWWRGATISECQHKP